LLTALRNGLAAHGSPRGGPRLARSRRFSRRIFSRNSLLRQGFLHDSCAFFRHVEAAGRPLDLTLNGLCR